MAFKIVNETEKASIYLYGRIGETWWGEGNSAKDFASKLDEFGGKPLDIFIDSPGGDVYTGFAMCSAIQKYAGHTTAHIDGMAASAASYIAAVCDDVEMNEFSWIMIHQASVSMWGNADDLENMVSRLRGIDDALVNIYEKRTCLTKQELVDYMAEEKWFNAAEAEETGFATKVIETEQRVAACVDAESAKLFKHLPQGVKIKSVAIEKTDSEENLTPGNNEGQEPFVSGEQEQPAFIAVSGRLYKKGE